VTPGAHSGLDAHHGLEAHATSLRPSGHRWAFLVWAGAAARKTLQFRAATVRIWRLPYFAEAKQKAAPAGRRQNSTAMREEMSTPKNNELSSRYEPQAIEIAIYQKWAIIKYFNFNVPHNLKHPSRYFILSLIPL
jgi:hypothetical protein